jgi:thiamine pyrophosphate-dependent acetolactate synthase large subunit-like protein
LQHFAESMGRAYKIAMTPPMGPVAIVASGKLQEEPIEENNLRIPKYSPTISPQGDSGAIARGAENRPNHPSSALPGSRYIAARKQFFADPLS